MKSAYWGYWLIVFGVFVFIVMMFTQTSTTFNTQDYYQIKEATEASLYESVDYAYYRTEGKLKINKEKFVANFLKRFSESASLNSTYTVSFYDLYEYPPKVSIEIKSTGGSFFIANTNTDVSTSTRLSAVLESLEGATDAQGNPLKDKIQCIWD